MTNYIRSLYDIHFDLIYTPIKLLIIYQKYLFLISFITIHPKFLLIVNNYINYNKCDF